MRPKKELIRVARSKEGDIFVDLIGKKTGRGAYVCKNRECFEKTIKAKKLEREFSSAIPEEVYVALRQQMEDVNDGG